MSRGIHLMASDLESSGQHHKREEIRRVRVGAHANPRAELPVVAKQIRGPTIPQHDIAAIFGGNELHAGELNEGTKPLGPPTADGRAKAARKNPLPIVGGLVSCPRHDRGGRGFAEIPGDDRTQ